jgi:hypothetical protein
MRNKNKLKIPRVEYNVRFGNTSIHEVRWRPSWDIVAVFSHRAFFFFFSPDESVHIIWIIFVYVVWVVEMLLLFLRMNLEPASYNWQNPHSLTWWLETGIVVPKETFIARQRLRHVWVGGLCSVLLCVVLLVLFSAVFEIEKRSTTHNTPAHREDLYIVAYSLLMGAVEAQKPRGTRLRNSSGALPSRALPPLPPHFAPHCALLGYAVNTGSRNLSVGKLVCLSLTADSDIAYLLSLSHPLYSQLCYLSVSPIVLGIQRTAMTRLASFCSSI